MTLHRPSPARAFSLVEVLVAVLVLALGLLGLGAVFPMVVRQQRLATETTLGLSARNGIQQILFNNANFADGARGWLALREYVIDNAVNPGDWVAVVPDKDTAAYILPAPGDGEPDVVLPLSQRLYPLPYTTTESPRFVWDMAARLIPNPEDPGDLDQPIMVVVFVRPIDPGIRTALREEANGGVVPYSLVTSFLDASLPGKDRRYPVSVDRDGRPTLDGSRTRGAEYSRVAVVNMGPPNGSGIFAAWDTFSVLDAPAGNQIQDPKIAEEALARLNQRFVDRSGYIYTVVSWQSVASRERINVKVSRGLEDTNGDGKVDPRTDLNPVVFVPQGSAIEPLIFTVDPRGAP